MALRGSQGYIIMQNELIGKLLNGEYDPVVWKEEPEISTYTTTVTVDGHDVLTTIEVVDSMCNSVITVEEHVPMTDEEKEQFVEMFFEKVE